MKDFLKGVKEVSPIISGVVPFGLIYGVSAINYGLNEIQTISMSYIIFAGASQIALVNQMFIDSSIFVSVATVFMINLRMAMYSASISPYFKDNNIFTKIIVSYLLTDQAYAVSIAKFNEDENINKVKFFLGAGITMWISWQISTVIGVFLGKTLPKGLSLEFAIPLTFLALLRPFLNKKYFVVTAIISGFTMIIFRNLPYNFGFFIAVFAGIFSGLFFKRLKNAV
ncbi:AzlC family ABC transporter permease [Deferribacter autotrophicus]|uniref:AzlC family ABC transporter permease n=1 Tax=Deferribacter autotrophicus TaxID=500465 RepID=A0A5A8F969_9BACT|nr:AzlC family ABC transporter permease [Deferribacter autotrophicus]KAA0259522.1 AzlC family ABC transporter permease [Deferribacter autotrophicus]